MDVAHLAATPIGRKVTGQAQVTRIDGRHVEFEVQAFDGSEQIGAGTHQRTLIDMAKFGERLKARYGAA